jgi:hypothetical protein
MLEKDSSSSKWEELVKELRGQWRLMWRERIDDKVLAEGIAREDYPLLFLDCGTIVVATRNYRAPDFFEILDHHNNLLRAEKNIDYANPIVGGWRKFIRSALTSQPRFTRRVRPEPVESKRKATLQKKKGGRGWIHRF